MYWPFADVFKFMAVAIVAGLAGTLGAKLALFFGFGASASEYVAGDSSALP
jgi:hypothetical protein